MRATIRRPRDDVHIAPSVLWAAIRHYSGRVKRLAAPLAALLLTVAAAGLSSEADDDYCWTRGPAMSEEFHGTSSAPIVLWPPGPQCRYETASGKTIATENLGDVAGFAIMLVVGGLAVFRRSRYTWAALIVLGLAGLFSLDFGFQGMFPALILGGCVALAATRSAIAAATAAGVLILGAIPYLWNGTTLGWALLLLLVSLGDGVLYGADNRLARFLAGPRADF